MSNLVTKVITITNSNGTTFTRKQKVRADSGANAEELNRLTNTPQVSATSDADEGREFARKILNETAANLKKKYKLVNKNNAPEMNNEQLQEYMKGELLDGQRYYDEYMDVATKKADDIVDDIVEGMDEDVLEAVQDYDFRTSVISEILDRSDIRDSIKLSIDDMDDAGWMGETGSYIEDIGDNPSEADVRRAALGLAGSLGMSPGDYSKHSYNLGEFVKRNPRSEVMVSWDEKPGDFIPKWNKEKQYVNVTNPVIFATDSQHLEGVALQLLDTTLSVQRSRVTVERDTTLAVDVGSEMMIGEVNPETDAFTVEASNKSERFVQNSKTLF